MKLAKFLITVASVFSTSAVVTANPQIQNTSSGLQYGVVSGKSSMPLVLILTTDIHDSIIGTFTPIGVLLNHAGYSVAAIDVTCHGKDVTSKEVAGLDCWAQRVRNSHKDIFAPMVARASAVIDDIGKRKIANVSNVIIVGVSRGGYAALKVAASDSRVNRIVLMAPVTNIARLEEFKETPVDKDIYGFGRSLQRLTKDHIFMQIGNADTRVGTADALAFESAVVAASGNDVADFTTIITPLHGHGTAMHDIAAQWVMKSFSDSLEKAKRAP